VWKFQVPVGDSVPLRLRARGDGVGKPVLFLVDRDPGLTWIWYEVDLDVTGEVEVQHHVFGTGHEVPDLWTHVGSARHDETGLVWHLYRRDPF
jgi:hypothetical protein